MNILFVTGYDAPTQLNLAVATSMRLDGDINLLKNDATRENLISAIVQLGEAEKVIFAMSHGGRDDLFDNESNSAINASDGSGMKIFAWACHTGSSLGCKMAKNDNIWWGYDGAVTAPDDREKYISVFSEIFKQIKNIFFDANDANDAIAVQKKLEIIKTMCLDGIEQLDNLIEEGEEDYFSLYSCCNQIWGRLCVWLPRSNFPEKHPEAPRPIIEYLL